MGHVGGMVSAVMPADAFRAPPREANYPRDFRDQHAEDVRGPYQYQPASGRASAAGHAHSAAASRYADPLPDHHPVPQEPPPPRTGHLFAPKASPAASARSRQPTADHAGHDLGISQVSFTSVDDNFATFQYDPAPAPHAAGPHLAGAAPGAGIPPLASPPAPRPHTTQNSPYRHDPLSPPYGARVGQARSATAAGFAPAGGYANGTLDLPPPPDEYVYRPPAPGSLLWDSTAIGRPTALKPLDSLPPHSVDIQPPCFHALRTRLATISHPRSHVGFLLGRAVGTGAERRLLLDRFDAGRRLPRGEDGEERYEPTVVVRGDVVVPVVAGPGRFGVGEWELMWMPRRER
ncbi:hypothetical protein DFJ74DRAFT_514708 [Hyaloraphidium curvatum]|nr:hypothetical protein DFJ74DRAFT_514708 [Hyaloraphidium curvatum]